jgi:Mg-chelatase subunit ChlD
MAVTFTSMAEKIQNGLAFTQAKGRTALLDCVYTAIHQMRKARDPRKAILIISDGGDDASRYTEGEVNDACRSLTFALCDRYL